MSASIQTVFQVSDAGTIVFTIAGSFLSLGIGAMVIIFLSRIVKSYRQRKRSALRSAFQKILNKIVVNETAGHFPDPAFEFYMAELRMFTERSAFARRLLIRQIMELKKNLTGNSAVALVRTYDALMLAGESRRKLRQRNWEERASGVRELAEMGSRESISLIRKSLGARNRTLREETLVAMVRLDEQPLAFLNHYDGVLSDWMRINLYNYLKKLDVRKLPPFSQWFAHPNQSVVMFAVSMTREFKQTSSLPALVNLIYSDNPRLVGMAIGAIGEMEAYQFREHVVQLSAHVWKFPRLTAKVVACLGRIGDPAEDCELLARYLRHPVYQVRFEAVGALKKFGADGEECLTVYNARYPHTIHSIISHFSDALLQ